MTDTGLREDLSYFLWIISEIVLTVGTVFWMKLTRGRAGKMIAVHFALVILVSSVIERLSLFVGTGEFKKDHDPILDRHIRRGKGLLELENRMVNKVAEDMRREVDRI